MIPPSPPDVLKVNRGSVSELSSQTTGSTSVKSGSFKRSLSLMDTDGGTSGGTGMPPGSLLK